MKMLVANRKGGIVARKLATDVCPGECCGPAGECPCVRGVIDQPGTLPDLDCECGEAYSLTISYDRRDERYNVQTVGGQRRETSSTYHLYYTTVFRYECRNPPGQRACVDAYVLNEVASSTGGPNGPESTDRHDQIDRTCSFSDAALCGTVGTNGVDYSALAVGAQYTPQNVHTSFDNGTNKSTQDLVTSGFASCDQGYFSDYEETNSERNYRFPTSSSYSKAYFKRRINVQWTKATTRECPPLGIGAFSAA